MKKVFLILLLMISSICYCQQFDGVSISGSQSSVVTAFRAKGYVIKRYFENCVSMTGKLAGENIEIYITNTPVSKKVFKIVVYFDTEDTWGELKYSYIKYYQLLSNKYGSPNDKYSFFQDPYYDGDGYEMTAVQLKKCVYAAYWMNMGNLNVGLSISEFKQIKIQYENIELLNLLNKELSLIQQRSL